MESDTINTLEFWEKVKEEYEDSPPSQYFMCWESNTFKDRWDTNVNEKRELESLGKKFLKDNISDEFKIYDGRGSLFQINENINYAYVSDPDKKQIRIDFINWNIERLNK